MNIVYFLQSSSVIVADAVLGVDTMTLSSELFRVKVNILSLPKSASLNPSKLASVTPLLEMLKFLEELVSGNPEIVIWTISGGVPCAVASTSRLSRSAASDTV